VQELPRTLKASDRERAVDVLAQAFADDPLWCHLVPGAAERRQTLPLLFHAEVGSSIQEREALGLGDPVQAVALWTFPPSAATLNIGGVFSTYGRLLVSRYLPLLLRTLRLYQHCLTLQRHYATQPHYYLDTLGVLPSAQGHGYASALVRPMLEECDRLGVGCYLETLKAAKVALYEHWGFECCEDYLVPRTNLHIWAMYRRSS